MGKVKWLVEPGQRFGRGTVVSEARLPGTGKRKTVRAVTLRCDCGIEYTTRLQDLIPVTQRSTKSCGCLRREAASVTMSRPENLARLAAYARSPEGRANSAAANTRNKTTHGLSHTSPLYRTWSNMMTRCYNQDYKQFKDYGGRGITVCKRWRSPSLFVEDIERLLGPRPSGMTLDRINNDRNYEPDNVRWASYAMQARNRRGGLRDTENRLAPRDGARSGLLYICWWQLVKKRPEEICLRWLDWPNFRDDIIRLIGPRPPGLRFHRINGRKLYEPGNVAWVTGAEQVKRAQEARWRK